MTRVLICSSDLNPCPPGHETWVAVHEVYDFEQLGITAPEVLYVLSWGLGFILFMWSLGYGIGVAVKLIRTV